MEIPQTGGTFIRNPNTGKLERQADHTAEVAPNAAPAPEDVDRPSEAEAPADEPTRKKVK